MTYPKWWDKTITIYNRYEDNTGRVEWYRKVLPGCFIKIVPSLVIAQGIGTEKSQLVIRIRKSNDYISPIEWLTSVFKNKKYTIQNGDIVVIGAVSDNVDEYASGHRSNDLLKKYGNSALIVRSVGLNDFGHKPHYKITG